MPSINDLFPSRYLKAHELQGHHPVVTIARVVLEPMGRTRETKPVVYFAGKAKGLRINKTVALGIAAIAGSEDTDHWAGTAIQLYATTASFGEKTYPVIRIQAATAPRLVPQKPQQKQGAA
jgi:hypothetical protein